MTRKLTVFTLLAVAFSGLCHAQEAGQVLKGRLSGLMYLDYFYNAGRDSGIGTLSNVATPGAKDFQGFQFRRIYFTYDNDLSEQFTARFRLEADQAALSSDGKVSVLVKDAFLRWKNIFQGSDLWVGFQPTPAYDISEAFWGYRSLEKTIMDLRGIVSSRDLGATLRGKFDDGGVFNYWLMAGNGNGNKPENDKFKRFYANLFLKPSANVQATLYGDYKAAGEINDDRSTLIPKATLNHGAFTGAVFLGYSEPNQFGFGVEGFVQSTSNGLKKPDTTYTSLNAYGVSVYARVNVQSDFSLVGRFDYFDPDGDASSAHDARNLFLVSLDYRPIPNVSVMPNVEIETYQSLATRSVDPSVTGRLTFAYTFQQ